MAVPRDAQEAKDLVRQICNDHGYFDTSKIYKLNPEYGRELDEVLLKKDTEIGSFVITVAKNLYTNKARFVFELLQNADDNSYKHAAASDSDPRVSFQVHPRRIVLECNEDGFTDVNLKAICQLGKSSKINQGAQGYIGEKGLGFKSVFMVAWKVHIQSGAFSFSFTHRPGDSGMGMISPVWEDTQETLEHPLTRITLHLHDTGDEKLLANTRHTIEEQFKDLQETFLLFIRNLRKIEVSFHNDTGEKESWATYSIDRPRDDYAILKKRWNAGNTVHEDVKYFHVTDYQATGLARNENREYSEAEKSNRADSNSQVVLAFPVSEVDIPIIKPQDVFVFLPVRPAGFNFIIQADFVTDASRQDIVKDSLRNNGLLDAIANAFAQAAVQFCRHEKLRYLWMRYLPGKNQQNMDQFWRSLTDRIAHRLREQPVLYCQKKNDPHRIQNLVRLTDLFRFNGKPLFDDGDTELLVSESYSQEDLSILHDYGLRTPSIGEFYEWVRQDLRAGRLSRYKSTPASDKWHTQTTRVFQDSFDRGLGGQIAGLKWMDLLPLEDGRWGSIMGGPVYFSHVDGIAIPSNLNLRVISKDVTDIQRLALFRALGTETASVALVRKAIFGRYSTNEEPTQLPLQVSKGHLEFLYLTENQEGVDNGELSYKRLSMHGRNGKGPIVCRPALMYIAGENDPYGPRELFRRTDPGPRPGDGAPGYDAIFVDEEYFRSNPRQPDTQRLSWTDWFYQRLGVQKYVQFLHNGSGSWKDGAEYLLSHRPEKFLGALLIHHQHNRDPTDTFVQCVQKTEVLCRGNRRASLKEAQFPTRRLEGLVERYVGPDAIFPWLWIEDKATFEDIPPDWKDMFTDYRVGIEEDLHFALTMLDHSSRVFSDGHSNRTRLFGLYHHIQAKYREAENMSAARQNLRFKFQNHAYTYIPLVGNTFTWAYLGVCVWDAPQLMRTKYVLRLLYEPYFRQDPTDFIYLERFFTDTLGIGGCTWQMYVRELQWQKSAGCNDIDLITVIYKELKTLGSNIITSMEKEEFRTAFESDALIFVPSDDGSSWYKVSQCVWSAAASLRGKVSLNRDYGDLEHLFVVLLGVKPIDLHMAIDELKEAGSRTKPSSVREVKDTIRTVNSLLAMKEKHPDPGNILDFRIFPIRYPGGEIQCGSRTTEFFVVDREPLRRPFEGRVKLLDFTLDEVVLLRPFLTWTRLEQRYLSVCVKEVTSFRDSGARPISNPDRNIRPRAHALLRIASHFDSPRTTSLQGKTALYETLRNATVYETDGVTSNLLLSQDAVSHTVEGKPRALHIHEDGGSLKIYVPAKHDDQVYTFNKALPERLFEWLMTHPATQITKEASKIGATVTRVVMLAPLSMIKMALEECGIGEGDVAITKEAVETVEEDAGSRKGISTPGITVEDDTEATVVCDDQEDVGSTPGGVDTTNSTAARSQQASAEYSGEDSLTGFEATPRTPSGSFASLSRLSVLPIRSVRTPSPVDVNNYVTLLDSMIVAGGKDRIPTREESSGRVLRDNISTTRSLSMFNIDVRGESQFERDCKIGAAGELYVYELLSHLDPKLPSFSEDNWQSNMRRYVTAHSDYADMKPWTGRETSDITYKDVGGVLTDLLILGGYLDRDTFSGKTPTYFIEVKATQLSSDAQFYMSKAQYSRMRNNVLGSGNTDEVYVIFRVYDLGRADRPLGLNVYLDPETLRLEGQLEFTASTWAVVPKRI